MNITCKNCNHPFKGNYCNNCGQAADTGRLNFDSVWEDIKYGLFHFNHKIVFTTKQLFYRPGQAIREYIEGKRLEYFKPISFMLVLASVYALLCHYLHLQIIVDNGDSNSVFAKIGFNETNEWILKHYTWVALLNVPIYTLASYLVFKKQGYNLIEHLVINSFLTAQRYIFLIVTIPIQYYFFNNGHATGYQRVTLFFEFLLMVWVYMQFFNHLPKGRTFLLILASYALVLVFATLVSALIIVTAQYLVR